MARYSDELRSVLTRIRRSPHHHCEGDEIVKVTKNISFRPPFRPRQPRIVERTIIDNDCCDHMPGPHCCDPLPGPHCCDPLPGPHCCDHRHGCDHRLPPLHDCHVDRCCCDLSYRDKDLFLPQRTVINRTTTVSADSTYSVLERWFKRYKNENGNLGLADLRELIQNLGRDLDKKEVRRVLKDADADGDNELSFREYLRMWHKAASHETDFLDATGCQDIVDIVNEYDLYPNVSCTDCGHHRFGKKDDHDSEDQGTCNCGSESDVVPFVKESNETNESGLTPLFRHKLPLFSCNRLPAVRPKNWRD